MIRSLYRGLLWLHPVSFQDRFGEELMWIFDIGDPEHSAAALLVDGMSSLIRQWLFRSNLWKFAVSFLINCVIFHKMILFFSGLERLSGLIH